MQDNCTSTVAAFTLETEVSDIPPAVLHSGQRLLIESVAASIFGSQLGLSRDIAGSFGTPLLPYALPRSSAPEDVAAAAFLNAAQVDCHDSVGGAQRSAVHPGKNLIPAVVSSWLASDVSGEELLVAICVAAEVAFRLDLAMGFPHKLRGHYSDGTIGTVAGACAISRLQGLSRRDTEGAIGNAGLLAPATVGGANMFASASRPLAMGQAAATAIRAASMARQGVHGPRDILGCVGGFGDALGAVSDFSKLTDGLGSTWFLPSHYLKPYVGCRLTHPARESLRDLRELHSLTADDIDSIEVRHPEQDLPVVAHHTDASANVVLRSCSEPFLLANVIVHNDLGQNVLSDVRAQDSELHAVAARIRLVPDSTLTRRSVESIDDLTTVRKRPMTMSVVLRSGETLTATADFAKGDPVAGFEMTDEELAQKFTSFASTALPPGSVARVHDLLKGIVALPDPSSCVHALQT